MRQPSEPSRAAVSSADAAAATAVVAAASEGVVWRGEIAARFNPDPLHVAEAASAKSIRSRRCVRCRRVSVVITWLMGSSPGSCPCSWKSYSGMCGRLSNGCRDRAGVVGCSVTRVRSLCLLCSDAPDTNAAHTNTASATTLSRVRDMAGSRGRRTESGVVQQEKKKARARVREQWSSALARCGLCVSRPAN